MSAISFRNLLARRIPKTITARSTVVITVSKVSSSRNTRNFTSTSHLKMRATCQCGTTTFETPTPQPKALYHCHCTECRVQSASAYGTSAIFPAAGLFPLSPDLAAKMGKWSRGADSGRTVDCYFCKTCGVRMLHRIIEKDGTPRETVSIKGGVLQGLDWSGAKHIFVRSAVVPIPEGAETYEAESPVMPGRDGQHVD